MAAMRFRDVNGTAVLPPWLGYLGDYQRIGRMMIPMSGAVEWELPEGPSPYWRGRIVAATYEFSPTAVPEPAMRAP